VAVAALIQRKQRVITLLDIASSVARASIAPARGCRPNPAKPTRLLPIMKSLRETAKFPADG